MTEPEQAGPPQPDPALRALDRFVGTWEFTGHMLGSDDENIVGRAAYRWLEGGFFLVQDVEIDFAGMFAVKSHELVGFDPASGTFKSQVYSNMSPLPLPYTWDVKGNDVTISVDYPPLDATFTGRYSEDGTSFSGGWRPNPGADPAVNVAYDIAGRRVDG